SPLLPHQPTIPLFPYTTLFRSGHNAFFDHGFVKAAVARTGIKRDPFHPFSCFDTASLAGLALGQTVLATACEMAGIPFDANQAQDRKSTRLNSSHASISYAVFC